MRKRKILFAHQSTIPFYRVEFYNTLKKLMPEEYEFEVVFDENESKRFYFTATDVSLFSFNTHKTKTANIKMFSRNIQLQTFSFKLLKYDMIIMGSTVRNLSYLMAFFLKLFGKKIGVLGKGRDYEQKHSDLINDFTERLKIYLANRADAFFAYTPGVKKYLVSQNVDPHKIFVVNNTINIVKNRDYFNQLFTKREELRKQNNFTNEKVLLYVGRFIGNKKMDFLIETFDYLIESNSNYRLMLIGNGETKIIDSILNSKNGKYIQYKGYVPDEEINVYYIISDLYIYPGVVGLGPLQAICYNLIPAVIDAQTHSAEYEYLNTNNSLILPNGIDAKTYGAKIAAFMEDESNFNKIRENAYSSIQYLSLENMAKNFIEGIEYTFKKDNK